MLALGAGARAQAPSLELTREVAPTPAGQWTSEVQRLRSEALGEELRLFIGKPPSFARSHLSYPVLYLLDGQYYFAEVLSVLAALTDSGQVPEMLLVGIESHDRRVDFTPEEITLPDVGARARASSYLDFLEHELVPALEGELRAGKPRVLLGHSHGALLALHAVAQRPQVFPWAVALDAPTHHEHGFIAQELLGALQRETRPSIRVASAQVVFGWTDESWARLRKAARPDDLLTRSVVEGESHESMLFPAAYRGLRELFADSSTLSARELAPLEIEARYRKLSVLYGAELTPPESLLRNVLEDFLMEGRGARAGAWLERYAAAYGKPADYAELAAQVKRVTALGEPSETVAELLALPRATPAEMKAHLGTWKGTSWMNDGPRTSESVRFWVEGGVVQGEVEHEEGPPQAVEYVRFRPDGALEFGFKNGMRPRGLLMHTERTPGGPLEGEVVFRGMNFVPPPDMGPVTIHFELERVDADAEGK